MKAKTKTTRPRTSQRSFPIVGVGASAGGLEAFTQLLTHLPADTGMGIVLVQHLDPTHESELARLLARCTSMRTQEVTDKMRVEPNQVYVIPPNMNLSIVCGVLRLEARPEGRRPQHAIDSFFESLAQDQRERAIGIILSGTANDGTLGLEAIKAEGGITFAQNESAKYDSMPRSAVAAGCVDFVLAPDRIAKELARIAQHPFILGSPLAGAGETATAHRDYAVALPSDGPGSPAMAVTEADEQAQQSETSARNEGFKKILLSLRNHSGVDFSLYKSTTIQRRISRRMVLGQYSNLEDYGTFLRGNSKELNTLFSDVLISVTNFFRNPEAFDVLKRVVFPAILKQQRNDAVRVWVMGCSTGQEAYSVAMAYAEFVEKIPRPPKLQIFATDLNEALLEKARAGLYTKTLAADLSPTRLRRFFVEEEGGYRVSKALREGVVFARQNLISDPPFSRMDLICCRNLLIYLEPASQKKAMPAFHYALNPTGFLFLGASESLGQFTHLFEPIDKKQKIFAKKMLAAAPLLIPALAPKQRNTKRHPIILPPALADGLRTELSAQREADRLMVNEFAPPGVIIDAGLQIIQFRGPTSPYLTPPRGKASFDVLKMACEGLLLPLRAAINKAKKEGKAVRKDNVRVFGDGFNWLINLQVIPLEKVKERCQLILFEKTADLIVDGAPVAGSTTQRRMARTAESNGKASAVADDNDRDAGARADARSLRLRLAASEHELADTREYLQLIQEEQDAANEELQAANEESQSANEELQSINEELETSKEELESTNEELTTINEEMSNRNSELNRLNADLNNLNQSIHTAILVLGRDLTIRRFTPLAEKAFNLIATDVGRSLSGIRHNLMAPIVVGLPSIQPIDLENLIRDVIDTVTVREREVQDFEGRWYSLRIRPYLTLDNKIDGAVLALVDIDQLKSSEAEIEAARDAAEAIVSTTRDPLIVLHGDLRVKMASNAFYTSFNIDPQATEGQLVYDLGNGQWNIPALRQLLEEILPRNGYFNDFEVTHNFQTIGTRTMLLNGRRLNSKAGVPHLILLAIEDITERKATQASALQAGERFRLLAQTLPQKIFSATPSGDVDYFNPQWMEYTGLSFEQIKGWGWQQLIHPDDLAQTVRLWRHCIDSGEPLAHLEHRLRRADGQYRWHTNQAVAFRDVDGKITMWVGANGDIHDVKEADQRKIEFLALLAHELRNPLAPISNGLHILQHQGATGATAQQAIDMMQRHVRQMARLVNDLLDVSRINQGKFALQRERIELQTVLNHSVEAARPQFNKMHQELTVSLPDQPIYLNVDPTRMAQIIGNLLNNAAKFTDRGGRIGLSVVTVNGQVVIRVTDNGVGIAPEQMSRIFEMFRQVDTSLERTQGGLGIGLTLVKNLVEMHGGSVTVHSEGLGHGSEFVLYFPELVEAPYLLLAPPVAGSAATLAIRRRVLVVDDNVDAATSIAMLLEIMGHEVYMAHDGVQAVDAAAQQQPDVILLDIGLPEINGYEAARCIRAQPHREGLVLIALTGWGQLDDVHRSKQAGFDFHLVKPVDLAVLETLLGSLPTALA